MLEINYFLVTKLPLFEGAPLFALPLRPQILPFALSFLHFAPSLDVFQNGPNKDYLGSNFFGSPKLLPKIKFENGPKKRTISD